jgi:hypothetical protein
MPNQHSARHCNRIILRVGSTRIYEDSTRMSAGSTRMRVQNLDFNMIDSFLLLKNMKILG